MNISRQLELSKDLIYKNNPSAIVVLDSRNRSIGIREMDLIHKALGMKMFGYHYMIYRDGTIHAGRPEKAFSCDIAVVTQSIQTNKVNSNESPFDIDNIEVESAGNVISSGRVFICLEGNTEVSDITHMQRNSLITLGRDIKARNRGLRGIHSLSEIIPSSNNLGIFVDMNSVRAEINSTLVPMYVSTPAGGISYTYGGRELSYNANDPVSGNDVKLVQLYLNALEIPVRDTSGVYNLFTHEAVRHFQRMSDLEITGSMTKKDYVVLQDKVKELAKVVDYSLYHRLLYYRPYNMLKGEDVDNIQGRLNRLRYVEVTGQFDSQMEVGIKQYQYDNGLTPDGEVGPITWRTIMDSIGIDFNRVITYNEGNPMSGSDVKFIQEKISYVARRFGISVFNINGIYDETTYNNVRKIQSQINFPINGIVDQRMFDYIVGMSDRERTGLDV